MRAELHLTPSSCPPLGPGLVAHSCLISLLLLSACTTPWRRTITEAELIANEEAYLEQCRSELEQIGETSRARLRREYEQADGDRTFDVLVLSGGGAFGAFGAGFLEGWGRIEDAEFTRPKFDQVSGISTGALIAPFAFVGTKDAYAEVVDLYRNPGRDWVRKRGLIPFLPGNVSLYDVGKLHQRVRASITPELVAELARGAQEKRQLIVGATNVDYGMLRVWDIAKLANEMEPASAVQRTALILKASSAIPGLFPPIELDRQLYVDGGAAMQMVGGISRRDWTEEHEAESALGFVQAGSPIRIRVWMVINQKLLPDPRLVRSRWTNIAARSLSTLIRTSVLQSIQDSASYIKAVDAVQAIDAEFRYVAIPQEFEIPDSDRMFDSKTMQALVELGIEMGADPTSWHADPLPPGAPFME